MYNKAQNHPLPRYKTKKKIKRSPNRKKANNLKNFFPNEFGVVFFVLFIFGQAKKKDIRCDQKQKKKNQLKT